MASFIFPKQITVTISLKETHLVLAKLSHFINLDFPEKNGFHQPQLPFGVFEVVLRSLYFDQLDEDLTHFTLNSVDYVGKKKTKR